MDVVKEKFGEHYVADERTCTMGIDIRFTDHLAKRFTDLVVLETCTGGGFSTISLAKHAKRVFTIEIDYSRMQNAKKNAKIAGVEDKITFIHLDVLSKELSTFITEIDAAFLDPDWAETGKEHVYKFVNSTTRPPSDKLLEKIFSITPNVSLIQPPFINQEEFNELLPHECERLYMNNSHELFCLHFGKLAKLIGNSEFRV